MSGFLGRTFYRGVEILSPWRLLPRNLPRYPITRETQSSLSRYPPFRATPTANPRTASAWLQILADRTAIRPKRTGTSQEHEAGKSHPDDDSAQLGIPIPCGGYSFRSMRPTSLPWHTGIKATSCCRGRWIRVAHYRPYGLT